MNANEAPVRMTVYRDELDGRASIKVTGPFDTISDRILEFSREIIEEGSREIVIDLSAASYMTSQGIACLLKVLKHAQGAECSLFVYRANTDMIDLIKLARIDKYIHFL